MVRKVILEPAFEVVPQASVIKRRLNVLSNGKQTRKVIQLTAVTT